jgi:predicted dienelactone hydrolase
MNIGKRTTLRWLTVTLLGSGLGACGGGSEDAPAPAPGSPSPPPPSSAAPYLSPQSLQADTPLDGYTVRATYASGPRDIPILVRHPAGTSGPLPLVLWSHGGDKSTDGKYSNVDWAAALVGAGYIMVSMTHLPRTDAQVDALAAEFGVDGTAANAAARQQFEANVDRPRDAIAVLNDLVNIEAAFPALRGRIDYERIGVGGHSRGAYTVRTVSGARVDLAPNLPAYSFIDSTATNQALAVQIAHRKFGSSGLSVGDLRPI